MTEVFLKIFNMSISASWLMLALLALRLMLKRSPKWIHMVLWAILAFRLLCPFSMESALSLVPNPETVHPGIMLSPSPEINTGFEPLNTVINPVLSESFTPNTGDSANPLQIWIPIAAAVWFMGVVLFFGYTVLSYWNLYRKLNTAVRLRRDIFQSEYVTSPFVFGIIRPKIYLPFSMTREDSRYVIAHERAHILRRDHWWKPLGFLLLSVHWFNPLMWLAYHLFCRDLELACDENVIKHMDDSHRADYAQALLACSVKGSGKMVCPLAFGEIRVQQRIKSVLNYKKPAFWLSLVGLAACILVSICFLTDPKQEPPAVEQTGQTEPSQTQMDAAEEPLDAKAQALDLAYFMELAIPGKVFQDMDPVVKKGFLEEYQDLLEGYTLQAGQSTDGAISYIVGYFSGEIEDNPLYGIAMHTEDTETGIQQVLSGDDGVRYVIEESFLDYSPEQGYLLIHPMDSGWNLHDVFNKYLSPWGRDYLLDAASRGIALATPEGPYLEVYLISEQWGEISEMIPLTEAQAKQILSEERQTLAEGYGFGAVLYPGTASTLKFEEEEGHFTPFLGVPQTVLDLATEKCGYRFASPREIQGTIVKAGLECSWLEETVYAKEEVLQKLQQILTNARYEYVGNCGYGAKLTIQMSDGSSMVLFKGTDGCDTIVFGSYGGYFIGEQENQEFWDIFGIDIESVWS